MRADLGPRGDGLARVRVDDRPRVAEEEAQHAGGSRGEVHVGGHVADPRSDGCAVVEVGAPAEELLAGAKRVPPGRALDLGARGRGPLEPARQNRARAGAVGPDANLRCRATDVTTGECLTRNGGEGNNGASEVWSQPHLDRDSGRRKEVRVEVENGLAVPRGASSTKDVIEKALGRVQREPAQACGWERRGAAAHEPPRDARRCSASLDEIRLRWNEAHQWAR